MAITPNAINELVGALIRKYREAQGWSQIELARRMGMISAMAISQMENGTQNINVVQLMALAKLFGVPPAVLLGDPPPGLSEQADKLNHAVQRQIKNIIETGDTMSAQFTTLLKMHMQFITAVAPTPKEDE